MVKFADTQKDKEQRRLQQQLAQQMQQLNTATWGNLTGLGGLTPQYLAVSVGVLGWGDKLVNGQTGRPLLCDSLVHPLTRQEVFREGSAMVVDGTLALVPEM